MSSSAQTDLAIVGAGVAGLAAAKLARAEGADVTVLEARSRIGGRALTDSDSLGATWDRGCHWLHNAETNPFRRIADDLGFAYKMTPTPQKLWLGDDWADTATAETLRSALDARFAAIDAAGKAGNDVAAAEVLPPPDKWSQLFAQWLAALSGADPEDCSTLDDSRYVDSRANWPVREGYGALVASWGADVPVHLNTRVTTIDWRARNTVSLTTDDGTLCARQVIVTVPTTVLAAEGIRFTPGLPDRHQRALEATPLGGANKVALAFDRDVFGTGMCHMSSKPHAPQGMAFQIRPFDRPLAIGYLGGRYARDMEAAGPRAMADRAMEILTDAFGTRIRDHVTGWTTTGWSQDPYSRGAYSIALPGRAHLRPEMETPIGPNLRLAGEACDVDAFGSVNGAFASGRRAASQALLGLRAVR